MARTIFTSAARTANTNSADFDLSNTEKGAVFYLDITARSGTSPTLDVKLQFKDELSGVYVDVPSASFAQKNATGSDTLVVYPGITATANRSVNGALGHTLRAVATIGGTTPSFTFTLSYDPLS